MARKLIPNTAAENLMIQLISREDLGLTHILSVESLQFVFFYCVSVHQSNAGTK